MEATQLERKQWDAQVVIAGVTLLGILAYTGLLYTPWISIERIEALSDALSMFYLGGFSVVGAIMGISQWMKRG
jgi:hypothetical protein